MIESDSVNFKKHDHDQSHKDSTLIKMIQEMDKTPKKSEPVAISVYAGTHTPSEMMGTPETPVQGASFRVLEKLLNDDGTGELLQIKQPWSDKL